MATSEWDEGIDAENQSTHHVSLATAPWAFLEPRRVIVEDISHRPEETRSYGTGSMADRILKARLAYRGGIIRINGAGF